MADKIINLRINVSAIDPSKLYQGEKGLYLDATLLYNEAKDGYGNNGMIVQQTSKEERAAGIKGAILGNGAVFVKDNSGNPPANVPSFLNAPSAAMQQASATAQAFQQGMHNRLANAPKQDLPF